MWTLSGPLSEKLNIKFVINSEKAFSGGQKRKKLHIDTKFHIFGSTSRHAFRSWIFQKLMQVRYTSDLRTWKKNTMWNIFFQFMALSISSIKELLLKPSEIQWNITGTLPGKLRRKISWALSYKIFPPEITKTWEMAILGGTLGTWEPKFQPLSFE